MEIERGGQTLVGYPALQDVSDKSGDGVALQVFDSPERAREVHRAGVRRLLAIAFRERLRDLEKALGKDMALAPAQGGHRRRGARPHVSFRRAADAAIRLCAARDGGPQPPQPHRAGNAAPCRDDPRRAGAGAKAHCRGAEGLAAGGRGCAAATGASAAARIPRPYALGAAAAFPALPEGGRACASRSCAQTRRATRSAWPSSRRWSRPGGDSLRRAPSWAAPASAELEQFGWLLEELRVSLFAQELKTPVPVSPKRLAKLWQSMRK